MKRKEKSPKINESKKVHKKESKKERSKHNTETIIPWFEIILFVIILYLGIYI